MLADGAHRLQHTLLGAHDEERLPGDGDGEIVAGVRDLLHAPDADPGPCEDGLALELEELRGRIAGAGQHGRPSDVGGRHRQLIENPQDDRAMRQSIHPVSPARAYSTSRRRKTSARPSMYSPILRPSVLKCSLARWASTAA